MSSDLKTKDLTKLPPLIYSTASFISFISLFGLCFTVIYLFPTDLDLNLLLIIILNIITGILGIASSFGLLRRKKWGWYGILFLIIFAFTSRASVQTIHLVNNFTAYSFGYFMQIVFVFGILFALARPLVKGLFSDIVKQKIYGITSENSLILKRVLGISIALSVSFIIMTYLLT
jgi:lysylphosphatidylglycerol synthetase-like protein (DUF2156 family)